MWVNIKRTSSRQTVVLCSPRLNNHIRTTILNSQYSRWKSNQLDCQDIESRYRHSHSCFFSNSCHHPEALCSPVVTDAVDVVYVVPELWAFGQTGCSDSIYIVQAGGWCRARQRRLCRIYICLSSVYIWDLCIGEEIIRWEGNCIYGIGDDCCFRGHRVMRIAPHDGLTRKRLVRSALGCLFSGGGREKIQ